MRKFFKRKFAKKGTLARKRKFTKSAKSTTQRAVGTPFTGKTIFDRPGAGVIINPYGDVVSLPGRPKSMSARLRWCESTITTSAMQTGTAGTGGAELVFKLNSLYAPSVGAIQPYGFDQMVNMGYNRYCVSKAHVKVTIGNGTAVDTGLMWSITPWPGGGAPSTLTGKEPYKAIAGGMGGVIMPQYLGMQAQTLVLDSQSIAQIQGLTDKQFLGERDSYSAEINADPSKIPYFRIAAFNQKGGSTGFYIDAVVEIIYDCIFYELQTVVAS